MSKITSLTSIFFIRQWKDILCQLEGGQNIISISLLDNNAYLYTGSSRNGNLKLRTGGYRGDLNGIPGNQFSPPGATE